MIHRHRWDSVRSYYFDPPDNFWVFVDECRKCGRTRDRIVPPEGRRP